MSGKISLDQISSRQTTTPKWFSPDSHITASCRTPNLSLIKFLSAHIERFITSYNVPDFSIALIDNTSTVWTRDFRNSCSSPKTYSEIKRANYSVNTVNHVFTAIAVLQQMEQGNLSIDKPYSKLFPNIPDTAFTLRDLLSYPSKLDPLSMENQQGGLPHLKGSSAVNYSHALTCAALEQASRQNIVDYMNRQLLPQLAMRQSSFHVTSYSDKPNTDVSPSSAFSYHLKTSVEDLSHVLKMVNRHGASSAERVLHPETIHTMMTAQTSNQRLGQHGLGWRIFQETHDSKLVGHLELSAFNSSSVLLLEMHSQVGIVILTNSQQCQLPLYTIAKNALTHMINIKRHTSGSP